MRRSQKVGKRPQRRITIVLVAALAGFAVAALTGLAVAKTGHSPVKTAHNAKLGETILIGGNGMTLYELAPETRHHLLCTSAVCLQFWPALKVHSAKVRLHKPSGLKGKLAILKRKGFFQVMLNGRPLYFFSGDSARGDANGQGIKTFGGTWHVVKTGRGTTSSTTTTMPSTTTTMPSTTTTMPSTTTTTPYPY